VALVEICLRIDTPGFTGFTVSVSEAVFPVPAVVAETAALVLS
jgi:hypothetical protein